MNFNFDDNLFITVAMLCIVGGYITYFVNWVLTQYANNKNEISYIVKGSIFRFVILILLVAFIFNGVKLDHVEEPIREKSVEEIQEVLDKSPTMEEINKKDSIREFNLLNAPLDGLSLEKEEKSNDKYLDSLVNKYK